MYSDAFGGAAALLADKPQFHVAPVEGWLNDPNGPLYYNGVYHMFFQHLPGSAIWGFKLVWGHATTKDLVHWHQQPHAIEPTPGTVDSYGCFSGCAAIDVDGSPALLYTGVRARGDANAGPLPPKECDLGEPFIESQCIVYADMRDGNEHLPYWKKEHVPIIALPPPNLGLAGWRDPYLVGPPTCHPELGYTMLIGSGIRGQGGTVLVYQSRNLTHGWQLAGELCSGTKENPPGAGVVWECPLLVKLPLLHAERQGIGGGGSAASAQQSAQAPGADGTQRGATPGPAAAQAAATADSTGPHTSSTSSSSNQAPSLRHTHFFCISPDACTNPSLYFLGEFQHDAQPEHVPRSTTLSQPAVAGTSGMRQCKFLIKEALGPFRLDLGDILYAPNTLLDEKNSRVLLWAWLQEARKVAGTYTYAGCLSLPRELWLDTSAGVDKPRMVQRVIPEAVALRRPGCSWIWVDPAVRKQQAKASLASSPVKKKAQQAATAAGWNGQGDVIQGLAGMQLGNSSSIAALPGDPVVAFADSIAQHRASPSLAGSASDDDDVGAGLNWDEPALVIAPGEPVPVPLAQGMFIDLELTFELVMPPSQQQERQAELAGRISESGTEDLPNSPHDTDDMPRRRMSGERPAAVAVPPVGACSGILLRSWQAGAEGSAAILYCWDTHVLEVVFEALDPETHQYSLAAPGCRRVGGKLQCPPAPGEALELRVLVDYSLVEVFTGGGEVLTTRVYRGNPPLGAGAGVDMVSIGCSTRVLKAGAHEMDSCWVQAEPSAATAAFSPQIPLQVPRTAAPPQPPLIPVAGPAPFQFATKDSMQSKDDLAALASRNSTGLSSPSADAAGSRDDASLLLPATVQQLLQQSAALLGQPWTVADELPAPSPPRSASVASDMAAASHAANTLQAGAVGGVDGMWSVPVGVEQASTSSAGATTTSVAAGSRRASGDGFRTQISRRSSRDGGGAAVGQQVSRRSSRDGGGGGGGLAAVTTGVNVARCAVPSPQQQQQAALFGMQRSIDGVACGDVARLPLGADSPLLMPASPTRALGGPWPVAQGAV